MTNDIVKITVPSWEDRQNMKTRADVLEFFSEAELVEIVHRYCNTQDASKKYRLAAAEKTKAVMARAKAEGWL